MAHASPRPHASLVWGGFSAECSWKRKEGGARRGPRRLHRGRRQALGCGCDVLSRWLSGGAPCSFGQCEADSSGQGAGLCGPEPLGRGAPNGRLSPGQPEKPSRPRTWRPYFAENKKHLRRGTRHSSCPTGSETGIHTKARGRRESRTPRAGVAPRCPHATPGTSNERRPPQHEAGSAWDLRPGLSPL